MIEIGPGAHEGLAGVPITRSRGETAYGIPVAFLAVRGLVRRGEEDALRAAMDGLVQEFLAMGDPDALFADARLAGYRALHVAIGKTGRLFVPAPESYLRLLLKRQGWRSLGRLVDCYNLVALRTRTSIGAHDLARLTLPVSLATMQGGETVQALGEDAPLVLTTGEYAYCDADGRLLGRLECRQAAHSRVTEATRDVLFIVQGHATLREDQLLVTVNALCAALRRYYGPWDSLALHLAS